MYEDKQKLLDELDKIMPLDLKINSNALSPRKTFRVGFGTSPNTRKRVRNNMNRNRLKKAFGTLKRRRNGQVIGRGNIRHFFPPNKN